MYMKKLMKKISVLVALVLILCMVACPISAVSESEFLTLQTPGENLRNDYPGFVGMKFTVGSSDLTITALGRLFYGGALGANDEEHEVRIVSADHTLVTSVVIPAGGTDGKVTYAPLKEKVVLKAGASYYLASLESTTDYWYGSVSEGGATFKMTGVATCNGAFYQTDEEALHYNLYDAVGPFVGVSFKYISSEKEPTSSKPISSTAPNKSQPTTQAESSIASNQTAESSSAPASTPASTPASAPTPDMSVKTEPKKLGKDTIEKTFFRSIAVATPRNNYEGFVGAKITIGSEPLTVTALGRMFIDGNTQSHELKIVDAATGTDLPGSSVTVNGGKGDEITYAKLDNPLVLEAGRTYYIVTKENMNGDFWYHNDGLISYESVAKIECAVFQDTSWYDEGNPNMAFGPVDFKYIADKSTSLIKDDTAETKPASSENGWIIWVIIAVVVVAGVVVTLIVLKKKQNNKNN